MSTFRIPSFTELRQSFLDIIRSLVPEAALAVGEDYEREANILAGVGQSIMGPLTTIEDQIFPDTANDENVALHGDLEGISRKQPNQAVGLALFTGTLGSVQSINSTLASITGIALTMTAPGTVSIAAWPPKRVLSFPNLNQMVVDTTAGISFGDAFNLGGQTYVIRDLPGGGAIIIYGLFQTVPDLSGAPVLITPVAALVVSIQANDTGITGNLEFNTVVTLDAPTSGVNGTGTIVSMSDGADLETFTAWGRRIKLKRQIPAIDANAQANRQWQEAIIGVDRGFCYGLYRGLGTADDVPQGVAGARHLSIVKRAAIQADIAPTSPLVGRVPAGGHDVLVTDFPDLFVTIDVSLTGGPGYGPDWGPVANRGYYQGFGATFASLNGTTLVFNIDRIYKFVVVFDAFSVDAITVASKIQSYDNLKVRFIASVFGGQVRITSVSNTFNSTVEIVTANAAAGFPTLEFGIRGGTMIVGAGSTTGRINTTVDPSTIIAAGSRVVLPVGPLFLEQRKVLSVDATGFVIEPALPAVPASGSMIYPGSSLIEPVRDLLRAMVDDLGPGDTSPPSRFPAPTDEFPAELTLNLIHSTVRKAKGLDDAVINFPSQNITPPAKAQIALNGLVLRYYT